MICLPRTIEAQVPWRPGLIAPSEWILEATWFGSDFDPNPRISEPWPVPGSFVLSGRHRLRPIYLVGDLPIATVLGKTNPCVDARCMEFAHGTVMGNPRIGMESSSGASTVGVATRLPLQGPARLGNEDWCCDQEAVARGFRAEHHDRLGAFLHEVWTLEAYVRSIVPVDAGRFVLRGGWERLDHVGDENGDIHRPAESSFHHWTFGSHFWTAAGSFTAGGGVTGRYWQDDLSDRLRYDVGIAAQWNGASLRPFLSARTTMGVESVDFGDRWRVGLGIAR